MTFHGISKPENDSCNESGISSYEFLSAMGVSMPPELNIFNLLQLFDILFRKSCKSKLK